MKKAITSTSTRKPSGNAEETLASRIAFLEETVDRLYWIRFYGKDRVKPRRRQVKTTVAQVKYVRATSDGWLLVKTGGSTESIPSGLKVSLTGSSGGRDTGTISEGALDGETFDVASGNLEESYRRVSDLKMKVVTRSSGPVVIDGIEYDLEVSIIYTESSAKKSLGPFPAKTDPDNPLPDGDHLVSIADFPHSLGSAYGAHGTVWFRLGTSGDRYLHPGKFSAGCLTCAPSNWEKIYQVVHCARKSSTIAGDLNFAPSMTVATETARRRRKAPA